jgi:glycosyltransferase involved in cell wall biosynthesis
MTVVSDTLRSHELETWGVAAAYTPAHAGLHQAIGDCAEAIGSRILTFDGGDEPVTREPGPPEVVRVRPSPAGLNRGAHVVWGGMRREADAIVHDAEALIVHSLFRGHCAWAASWAARHGRPYVAIPHGCLDPWGMAQKPVAKRVWMAACGRDYLAGAASVVFSTRRELEKARPWIDRDDATVIRWPVAADLASERAISEHRQTFRRRHGIGADARVLLFLGRLHSLKRPRHTIAAFIDAQPRNTVLVMAGMDGDFSSMQLLAAIPAASRAVVRVIGPVFGAGKAEAFHGSDGFISLSFRENFGYSMAEAMAHGLPVIVSPGHDLAVDVATDFDGRFPCGWLLRSDSPSEAATAVAAFSTITPGQLARMGADGREWAARNLAVMRFREDLRSLLVRVVRSTSLGLRSPMPRANRRCVAPR